MVGWLLFDTSAWLRGYASVSIVLNKVDLFFHISTNVQKWNFDISNKRSHRRISGAVGSISLVASQVYDRNVVNNVYGAITDQL